MVGNDRSLTNALTIVTSIAVTHFVLVWLQQRSPLLDECSMAHRWFCLRRVSGTGERWIELAVQDQDVMAAARDKGLERPIKSSPPLSSAMERSASSSHQPSPNGVSAGRTLSGKDSTNYGFLTSPNPSKIRAKVNDEIAVGSDPEFQRRRLRFEHGLWAVFTLSSYWMCLGFSVADTWQKAEGPYDGWNSGRAIRSVERYSTPSIMTVQFGPSAIHDGESATLG